MFNLKSWAGALCAILMLTTGAAKADIISTEQLLTNPNFNTLSGWTTAGGVLLTSMNVGGQWIPGIYSKSSSYSARQTIDLSSFNAGLIDSGLFKYNASTWQQGYSGDSDRGRLIMYFYDANNQLIQSSTLGYKDTNAPSKTDLSGYIPAATRKITYSLEGVRYGGTDLNAVFAQNSLSFAAESSVISFHGGYFVKGQQVVPPADVPAPFMYASGLLFLMVGARRFLR